MIDKLDHLVDTGITALELMPLADFAGSRNWGYDGVLWYAPDSAYGRPDDLKALIDEAHLRGLMVFLDVVYNHFGPEGNYLGRYAPSFFTEAQTPWGSAIDYRVREVRAFAIDNALYWLREYRFDGLRLDAVHAISEPGEISMLHELSKCGRHARRRDRPPHPSGARKRRQRRAACWSLATEPAARQIPRAMERRLSSRLACAADRRSHGYYRDYQRSPLQRHRPRARRRALSTRAKPPRIAAVDRAASRAAACRRLPSSISCRTTTRSATARSATGSKAWRSPRAIEAALAITLLAPMVPMLFMGEEWGSKAPFPFFCDFEGDLADAVRKGRRKEFAGAYAKYGDEIPDPLAHRPFNPRCWIGNRATGNRADAAAGAGARTARDPPARDRSRGLPVRRSAMRTRRTTVLLTAHWRMGDGATLALIANLSNREIARPASAASGHPDLGRRDRPT